MNQNDELIILKSKHLNLFNLESRTRVGDEFQATTKFFDSLSKDKSLNFKETLIWSPTDKLNDSQSIFLNKKQKLNPI